MRHHRPFLVLWVLAVFASVAAFVLHLGMRSRTMNLGYELGRARAEQARLREVRRVLELEVASYHTPQRVEVVARTLLGMEPPSPDRIIAMPGLAQPPHSPAFEGTAAARPGSLVVASRGVRAAGSAQGPLAPPPAATELLLPRITPPKTAAQPAGSALP